MVRKEAAVMRTKEQIEAKIADYKKKIADLNGKIKVARQDQSKVSADQRIADTKRVIENCELNKAEFEGYVDCLEGVLNAQEAGKEQALSFIQSKRSVAQSQVRLMNWCDLRDDANI